MINKTDTKLATEVIRKGIPPAPIIFIKLLELFAQEDQDCEAVTKTIQKDPGLTASVLLMSNSAAFGGSTATHSVEEAVLRIGFARIRRMVTMLCAEKVIRLPKSSVYKENQLWEHSLATAIASRQLAIQVGHDENHAFTVGLLHDLGKILLVHGMPEYAQLYVRSFQEPAPLFVLENETLGTNHCDLGYLVLKEWKAPEEFYTGIQDHHCPSDVISGIVYLADQIAYRIEKGFGAPPIVPAEEIPIIQVLDITPQQIEQLCPLVSEQLEREKASLQPAFTRKQ